MIYLTIALLWVMCGMFSLQIDKLSGRLWEAKDQGRRALCKEITGGDLFIAILFWWLIAPFQLKDMYRENKQLSLHHKGN